MVYMMIIMNERRKIAGGPGRQITVHAGLERRYSAAAYAARGRADARYFDAAAEAATAT
jgi:hypothetical protein